MAKLDLADGYYRVPLSPLAALELAVVLPGDGPYEQLIGIPLSLPMGWSLSPPFFCAFTETVTDMANASSSHPALPLHPLEDTLQLSPIPGRLEFHAGALLPVGKPSLPPLSTVDVYLDDFMAIAQQPRHKKTMRCLLHSIDAIFYDTPSPSVRRHIISESKIAKGEASWSTTKTILGWNIDTATMTLALPEHRQHRLLSSLRLMGTKQRVSRKKWQQLLGELRSVALAISGAKYNFSLLQTALTQQCQPRIRITSLLRQALHDWTQLLQQLSIPMPLHHVAPRAPDIIVGCDASVLGVGGWLWDPSNPTTVHLWRHPFSPDIQRRLVSRTHQLAASDSHINNSELELAGVVLSTYLATDLCHHSHPNIWCTSDNMAAVAWANNGSTSSTAPSAFLLRALGQLSQRRRFNLSVYYLPGSANTIADSLSRRFDCPWTFFLDDMLPPLSPQTSWNIVHLPTAAILSVTSALSRQIWDGVCPPETLRHNQQHGNCGNPFAMICDKTLSFKPTPTQSHSCNFLPAATAQAPWLPVVVKSQLRRWHEPFVPWGRRWPHWDSPIQGRLNRTPSICGLPGNWQPMRKTIHRRNETNQFPYPSYAKPWTIGSWPTHTKHEQ
jgi:hypothetical protein